MRILTTPAQVRRVSGIDGPGDFPDYPYHEALLLPKEVGRLLSDGLDGLDWPADRDFMNEDGGFIVVLDRPEEFELPLFGLPDVTLMEDIRRIEVGDRVWWLCLALANNETSIDYVFKEQVCPADVLAQLTEQIG